MAANTIGGLRIGYIVTIRAHIHGSEQHNINIDPGPGCINIMESAAADCSECLLVMHSEIDEPSDRN